MAATLVGSSSDGREPSWYLSSRTVRDIGISPRFSSSADAGCGGAQRVCSWDWFSCTFDGLHFDWFYAMRDCWLFFIILYWFSSSGQGKIVVLATPWSMPAEWNFARTPNILMGLIASASLLWDAFSFRVTADITIYYYSTKNAWTADLWYFSLLAIWDITFFI